MAKEKKPADQNFEALLQRLEAVLDSLEHGDLPLEQAMAAFERGGWSGAGLPPEAG